MDALPKPNMTFHFSAAVAAAPWVAKRGALASQRMLIFSIALQLPNMYEKQVPNENATDPFELSSLWSLPRLRRDLAVFDTALQQIHMLHRKISSHGGAQSIDQTEEASSSA